MVTWFDEGVAVSYATEKEEQKVGVQAREGLLACWRKRRARRVQVRPKAVLKPGSCLCAWLARVHIDLFETAACRGRVA